MVAANSVYSYGGLVQPALTSPASALPVAERTPRTASEARRTRRRYWSIRDLSRRIWLGRGYGLLRALIHSGVLPATRSTRSWWIDDEDAAGLIAVFEDRAGKVRAFHRLERWLSERCFVVSLTPELEALKQATQAVFVWRGRAYLPQDRWQILDGGNFRHQSGVVVAGERSVDGLVEQSPDTVGAGEDGENTESLAA